MHTYYNPLLLISIHTKNQKCALLTTQKSQDVKVLKKGLQYSYDEDEDGDEEEDSDRDGDEDADEDEDEGGNEDADRDEDEDTDKIEELEDADDFSTRFISCQS